MKRVIISAALLLCISGYAAAQSSAAKSEKSQKTSAKKCCKAHSTKQTLKEENASSAKVEAVKLVLPIPRFPVDSTSVPLVRKEGE